MQLIGLLLLDNYKQFSKGSIFNLNSNYLITYKGKLLKKDFKNNLKIEKTDSLLNKSIKVCFDKIENNLDIISIIGKNGSGKTNLLYLISYVLLNQESDNNIEKEINKEVFIFQENIINKTSILAIYKKQNKENESQAFGLLKIKDIYDDYFNITSDININLLQRYLNGNSLKIDSFSDFYNNSEKKINKLLNGINSNCLNYNIYKELKNNKTNINNLFLTKTLVDTFDLKINFLFNIPGEYYDINEKKTLTDNFLGSHKYYEKIYSIYFCVSLIIFIINKNKKKISNYNNISVNINNFIKDDLSKNNQYFFDGFLQNKNLIEFVIKYRDLLILYYKKRFLKNAKYSQFPEEEKKIIKLLENIFNNDVETFIKSDSSKSLKYEKIFNVPDNDLYNLIWEEIQKDTTELTFSINLNFGKIKNLNQKLFENIIKFSRYSLKFDFKFLDGLYFGDLSSGERTLLITFLIIHKFIEENPDYNDFMFLIDEPDLYIHIDWQRRYIKLLIDNVIKELSIKGKNIQFVITTHSPFLISDLFNDNIIFLSKDLHENKPMNMETLFKETKINIKSSFAANYIDLLGTFFIDNTMGEFSTQILNKLKEIRKERIQKKLSDIENNEIINQIGDEFVKSYFMFLDL